MTAALRRRIVKPAVVSSVRSLLRQRRPKLDPVDILAVGPAGACTLAVDGKRVAGDFRRVKRVVHALTAVGAFVWNDPIGRVRRAQRTIGWSPREIHPQQSIG